MTEDKMVGWDHQLNGHEFEQAPGDGEEQGSLACCSPWGRKEQDTTEQLKNNKVQASQLDQLDLDSLKKINTLAPLSNSQSQCGASWLLPAPLPNPRSQYHPHIQASHLQYLQRGHSSCFSEPQATSFKVSISQCGRGSLRFPYGNV